jgi:hypothetical protein
LKILIRPRNRTAEVDEHLEEFVWRRKHNAYLWDAFIAALQEVQDLKQYRCPPCNDEQRR